MNDLKVTDWKLFYFIMAIQLWKDPLILTKILTNKQLRWEQKEKKFPKCQIYNWNIEVSINLGKGQLQALFTDNLTGKNKDTPMSIWKIISWPKVPCLHISKVKQLTGNSQNNTIIQQKIFQRRFYSLPITFLFLSVNI